MLGWRRALGAMGALALLSALLAGLVSDWVCGVLLLGRWSPLHMAGIVLAALVGGILLVLAWTLSEEQAKAITSRLLTAAASVALTLLAIDIGMRLTDPPAVYPQPFYKNHPILGHFLVPDSRHRFLTPDLRYTTFVTDDLGLIVRGKSNDPDPNATRVMFLGDSFIEGVQIPPTANMSVLAENLLNAAGDGTYQSINLGVSAYSPVQYYLTYKLFAPTFDPAIVVVGVFIGNDFKDSTRLHEDGWITTDDAGLPVAIHPRMEEGMVMVNPAAEPVPASSLKSTIVSPDLWHHGLINTVFFAGYRPYCEGRQRAQQRAALDAAYEDRLAKIGDSSGLLTVDVPDQAEIDSWSYLRDDLDLLVHQVEADGRRLVIVIIPDYRQIPGQGMGLRSAEALPTQVAVWSDAPQRYLNDYCQSRGLTCVDLLPLFEEHSEADEQIYWSNDVHLTERGHELAAQAIAEAILNQK